MKDLKICPFCKEKKVFIGVHDDEGNYHGRIGCEYEKAPWSGLSYALHHEGWGECILCTDGAETSMGGVLFDTAEEAAEEWNKSEKMTPKEPIEDDDRHLCCPTCIGPVTNYWRPGLTPKHCQFCGQALEWDWGEEAKA